MKKILFLLLFGYSSWLYASEENEECQLWLELSVVIQNATNHYDKDLDGNEEFQNKTEKYLTKLHRIFDAMSEKEILSSRSLEIPYDKESEYWGMVNGFLRHDLSPNYGAFVSWELLGMGVEADTKYEEQYSDESKEVGYFEITVRLPEEKLKEFEKRFEVLLDEKK